MNSLLISLGAFGLGSSELIILLFVVLVVALLPAIFYLLMLQRTLELVSPDLRKMSPGQVWLMLIPIFGIVWHFLMVGYVADSLAGEFRRRNLPVDQERPGYQLGLTMCILNVCTIIPFLGNLAALAGLVLWIVYWVKINGYKTQLEQHNQHNPFQGQQQYFRTY